jgi:hypothetical protein
MSLITEYHNEGSFNTVNTTVGYSLCLEELLSRRSVFWAVTPCFTDFDCCLFHAGLFLGLHCNPENLPPKRRVTFNGHGVVSHKTGFLIVISAVTFNLKTIIEILLSLP